MAIRYNGNGNGANGNGDGGDDAHVVSRYEVTGEWLAKARLTPRQRLDIGLDLLTGVAVNTRPTQKAVAATMRIPVLELRRHARRRAKAAKKATPASLTPARQIALEDWWRGLSPAECEGFLLDRIATLQVQQPRRRLLREAAAAISSWSLCCA
jgi:hypothetical protein